MTATSNLHSCAVSGVTQRESKAANDAGKEVHDAQEEVRKALNEVKTKVCFKLLVPLQFATTLSAPKFIQ